MASAQTGQYVTNLAPVCLLVLSFAVPMQSGRAADIVTYHGYTKAVELRNDSVRVVLCPEVGGRVLEYSLNGRNVLYLSPAEQAWKPGQPTHSSAGRFDIGPEMTTPRRPVLWSGEWSAEITGERSARLISAVDDSTGTQLIRDFKLDADSTHLACTQTITNVSSQVREYCHWSRTFAVGKGICLVPLGTEGDHPASRFPHQYVMYQNGQVIDFRPDDPNIRRQGNFLEVHPTPQKPKLGFDSYAGQLIYLAPNDLLFLKRFKTYPKRVYNEAAGLTISIWYPDREMVELEPIGPRETLQPGESASFTEDWWIAPFAFPENGEVDLNSVQAATAKAK